MISVQRVPSVGSAVTVNSVVAAKEGPGKASAALPAVQSLSTRGKKGGGRVKPHSDLPLPRLLKSVVSDTTHCRAM